MALTKVSSSLVSDNAITTGKLVDGGVHSADIATNAITSTKIAQNSILTKHIDDGQVTTDQLGADAVTAAKIADDAISEEHLDVTVITSLTAVTAATGDLLMVADVSDSNNLKKIPVSSILAGTHTGAINTSGTISSGAITSSGNLHAGDGANISMDGSGNGQLEVDGNGYTGAIALDATAMHVYHNSSSRSLILGTNETARLTIGGTGGFNFQSNPVQGITTLSSGAITTTGTLTVAENILSTSGSPLVLSAADGGSNIELYANGTAFIDATTTSFRGTNGSGTGNISVGNLTTGGVIYLPGSTLGVVTVQDSYSSGALANQGLLRSSGGNYWGYSTYQSGSANWKSAVSVASERAVYAMDEDTAYWSYAPSQTVAIGSDLTTQPTEKITFDLQNGRVGIGTETPTAALQVGKGISSGPPAAGASTASACFGNDTSDDNYGLVLGADGFGKGYISAQRTDGTATTYDLSIQPNGGNVGIGTSNPNDILDIHKANSQLRLTDTDDSKFVQFSYSGGKLIIRNNSTNTTDNQLTLLESGNVGVGTISPLDHLHINDDSGDARLLIDGHTGFDAEVKFAEAGTVKYTIGHDAGTDNFVIGTTNVDTGQRLVIDSSGKVGIGTSSPTNGKVHIVGDASYVGDYGYSTLVLEDSSGYAGLNLRNGNNNWLMRNAGDNNRLQIVSSSNASGPGVGTYTPRIVVMQAGNVGIGTDNPTEKLEVDGGLKISNSNSRLYFGTEGGTSYRALEGNTSGSLLQVGESYTDIALQGNVGINTTDPHGRLDVKGGITIINGNVDFGTHNHSSYGSLVDSGQLDFTVGYSGTMTASRNFVFTYEATSWKAWGCEIEMASTEGLAVYKVGGYNNNSAGHNSYEQNDQNAMASLSYSRSGQQNIITLGFDRTHIHPCFKVRYWQSGGDGAPRMNRVKVELT